MLDENKDRVAVVAARGVSWEVEAGAISWTCGWVATRMSSLKRWCTGSDPLGAGTGLPDESVYVQSFDAKKLRESSRRWLARWNHRPGGGGWLPIAARSWWQGGRQCRHLRIEREVRRTSTVTPTFAFVTSIAGLETKQVKEGKRREKRVTFANRFLLGFFMNETCIGAGC